MTNDQETSDELLSAFVDGELDATEKSLLLERLSESSALRARVCELWQLKEMVRGGYPLEAVPKRLGQIRTQSRTKLSRSRFAQMLAACLMLVVGAAMGWLARDTHDPVRSAKFELGAKRANEGKVILHLASSDSARLKSALDEAEELAASRDKKGNPVRVELVTNAGGLNLLRSDASPYADRIRALRQEYTNLHFLACQTAIDNLIRKGIEVDLLPQAEITESAVDQIIKRIKQGWVYIQI